MAENLVGMVVAISDLINDGDEYRDDIIGIGRRILFVMNNDECSSFVGRVIGDDQMVVETVFPPVNADCEVMFGGFQFDQRD
ncbi:MULTISPECIES: hypothetical protein [Rhodospirillales]|jgi:hypothetical protein|uniref:Uncharacterized protein n=1 Tax=Paramagnetospirillum caucaseum TaxID=1244869 RepID=M3A5I9_9PROT|nr:MULTISPECIES: hypothetical protein [Rhodospirillales]EME67734.1 hypothetical protein H261_22003 [Paramagnetospirillum caucaseum]